MPESSEGPFTNASRGDSEQAIRDTLARLEAKIDRLAGQLADAEAEAETILRRAAAPAVPVSPRRRTSSPRRRGDTFLLVVKAAVIAAVSLGVIFAMLAPRHWRDQRYSPRCSVACARPAAHHSRSANRG